MYLRLSNKHSERYISFRSFEKISYTDFSKSCAQVVFLVDDHLSRCGAELGVKDLGASQPPVKSTMTSPIPLTIEKTIWFSAARNNAYLGRKFYANFARSFGSDFFHWSGTILILDTKNILLPHLMISKNKINISTRKREVKIRLYNWILQQKNVKFG